jgi:competence ComEA-like helix-hairpin-helix protein
MGRASSIFLSIAASGFLSAAVLLTAEAQQADDPGVGVFTNVCGKCHPKERAVVQRRTRSQWEEVITTMITARNAQISDEDFDTVLGYLTREHGRVNVNRAPAPDIVEVLHVADKVGETIVQYRKQYGPFEDFDGLVKVPGVEREKLELLRDAILFQ